MTKKQSQTILFDPAGWKAEVISQGRSRSLTLGETWRLCYAYVCYMSSGNGKGGKLSRLMTVLTKAVTLSLKPSQLSSLKPTVTTYLPKSNDLSKMSVEELAEEWERFNRTV